MSGRRRVRTPPQPAGTVTLTQAMSHYAHPGTEVGTADIEGISASICVCGECAANMSVRMLGVSAHSTAAVQRAAAAVAEVHRREGAATVEQLRAFCMPGALFTAEQFGLQTVLKLENGVLTDWVAVCKTAADELQHQELAEELQQCVGTI